MADLPNIVKILREEEKKGILTSTITCTTQQITHKNIPSSKAEPTTTMIQQQIDPQQYKKIHELPSEKTTDTLYETIINAFSDIFYIFDKNGTLIKWNSSLEKTTLYSTTELKHMKVTDFFEYNERKKVSKNIQTIFEKKTIQFEANLLTKTHTKIPYYFSVKLLQAKDNKSLILGIGKDISELKRLKECVEQRTQALKESQEHLDDLIQNANDMIQSVDPQLRFIYVNIAWKKILGYTEPEIKQLRLTDILRPDQKKHCLQTFHDVSKGKQIQSVETVFITKQGKEIQVQGNVNGLFRNGEFISIRAIFRDVTEQKKASKELKEAHIILKNINQELERKVEERTTQIQNLLVQKDQFIGQLGHDLKTPLSILINILPMIKEAIKNPEAKADCEIALRNVNYIKHLVIETLQIAELSSPNLSLEKKKTNLKDLISEVIKDNQPVSNTKNIRVINLILTDVLISLDTLKIKEVLYNLLNNAIKSTPEDGRITFDCYDNRDGTITIELADTGIGMTHEQIKKVFDDFYKADISRHDLAGSGLGLGICRRIIEKHEGKMWAESDGEGKGSHFYFTIPK